MEKYISVVGALIPASNSLTVLMVLVIVLLFVVLETIRHRRKVDSEVVL